MAKFGIWQPDRHISSVWAAWHAYFLSLGTLAGIFLHSGQPDSHISLVGTLTYIFPQSGQPGRHISSVWAAWQTYFLSLGSLAAIFPQSGQPGRHISSV